MTRISIVIICRNEAAVIGQTLASIRDVSDDIIVYDNGSTDGTQAIVRQYPARLVEGKWEGFGITKNKANTLARHDWVLSLDADESIDAGLKESLLNFQPADNSEVFRIRFKNFLGSKHLRYGEWGNDSHVRLFNRKTTSWDDADVHEKLIYPANVKEKKIRGAILHHTAKDITDYAAKMREYAMLNAEKYYKLGRKSSWLKIRIAPAFGFFINFIIKGGFLDGRAGYICAKMTAYYSFLKYARLKELNKMTDQK
jgi:glycosyltransferase involved in cell wall biosynthesis